jgi:hypothetical protein
MLIYLEYLKIIIIAQKRFGKCQEGSYIDLEKLIKPINSNWSIIRN